MMPQLVKRSSTSNRKAAWSKAAGLRLVPAQSGGAAGTEFIAPACA